MAKAKSKAAPEPVAEETKAVAVPETKAAAVTDGSMNDVSAWGTGGVSANDIIIPRINLMQGMSQKVMDGDAAFGEFRESLDNTLLGKFDQAFEIVPFAMRKIFVEYDATDEKNKEFLRVVPITPQNENLPYEDSEKDEKGKIIPVTRDRVMEFYCLLPAELDTGGAIPYILSFRRSSIKAGKKLATQMYVKNQAAGKTPASVIMTVMAEKTQNDKGTFAVMDITPSRPTPDKYMAEAFKWLQTVQSGKAKAHEESYNDDDTARGVEAEVDLDKGPTRF